MGELLGLGLSHYPPMAGTDDAMADILRGTLKRPDIPASAKDPANWPAPMRAEWGEDEGRSAAPKHRAEFVKQARIIRDELDAFKPDFVVMFGDDQYENFKEDIIPPFCVYAWDDIQATPHTRRGRPMPPNAWGEPNDLVLPVKGHRQAAKFLVRGLLKRKVDIAYSYESLHYDGLSHAFLNGIMYLDYDRNGWPYPTIPIAINCYGSRVIANQGGRFPVGGLEMDDMDIDPPGPSPERCMEVGAAIVEVFKDSPWRVALIASSGWSHAFLTKKHNLLYPDVEQDQRLYSALATGDYDFWRSVEIEQVEDRGEQEVLNWWVLMGAMEALGHKEPDYHGFVESYIFNSNKCFAAWRPR
jgi:hypothetical protein